PPHQLARRRRGRPPPQRRTPGRPRLPQPPRPRAGSTRRRTRLPLTRSAGILPAIVCSPRGSTPAPPFPPPSIDFDPVRVLRCALRVPMTKNGKPFHSFPSLDAANRAPQVRSNLFPAIQPVASV